MRHLSVSYIVVHATLPDLSVFVRYLIRAVSSRIAVNSSVWNWTAYREDSGEFSRTFLNRAQRQNDVSFESKEIDQIREPLNKVI